MNLAKPLTSTYYHLKPVIPRRFQIWMRSKVARRQRHANAKVWPILEKAGRLPDLWPGWPQKKSFALVLTHDVETAQGQNKCRPLIELEKSMGLRSSFNFVPERYVVSSELRTHLTEEGFEVGIHGLNHDGKLYSSKRIFQKRADKINHYLKTWEAVGFRSPAMHHNLEWIHYLNIEYDLSTFDTDPFGPQPDGVETIFPFWVQNKLFQNGYVELPCTMPQDFLLFVLMKVRGIKEWKNKLDWIAAHKGMVLLNTHPDYMKFYGGKPGFEEYPIRYYLELLNYIETKYKNCYWNALPRQISTFLKANRESHEKNTSQIAN